MSITRQNLSVVIVSYKSEHVIENCINSIGSEIEIIIIENSNNIEFKKKIENKYKNVKCILSRENLDASINLRFFFLLRILTAFFSNPLPIITSKKTLFNSSAKDLETLKLHETTPPKALKGSHANADL